MPTSQPEGYLAEPSAGTGPGVLVLHPWWGLNATIKDVCDRLAAEGFVAFAPDLYHGKVATTIPEAEALGSALDARADQAMAEIAAAADLLWAHADHSSGGLAVLAFSLGAYYAMELSRDDPERIRAVVLFYGTGGEDVQETRAAFLGHFAQNDDYEPPAAIDALEAALQAAGRPVTFYRYEGLGHWFFEPDRTDAYNAAAAQLAWERTLAFLKATLSG